jgi:hypothetical protein
MNKIEEYIKFICKNTRGTKKEIEELKQETNVHIKHMTTRQIPFYIEKHLQSKHYFLVSSL